MSVQRDQITRFLAILLAQCLCDQLQPNNKLEIMPQFIAQYDDYILPPTTISAEMWKQFSFAEVNMQGQNSTCPQQSSIRIIQCHCRLANPDMVSSGPEFELVWHENFEHRCKYYSWTTDGDTEFVVLVKLKKGQWCSFSCEVRYTNPNVTIDDVFRITFNVTGTSSSLEEQSVADARRIHVGFFVVVCGLVVYLLALLALRWYSNRHLRISDEEIEEMLKAKRDRFSSGSLGRVSVTDNFVKKKSLLRKRSRSKKYNQKRVVFYDEFIARYEMMNSPSETRGSADTSSDPKQSQRKRKSVQFESESPSSECSSPGVKGATQEIPQQQRKYRSKSKIRKVGTSIDKDRCRLAQRNYVNNTGKIAEEELSSSVDKDVLSENVQAEQS